MARAQVMGYSIPPGSKFLDQATLVKRAQEAGMKITKLKDGTVIVGGSRRDPEGPGPGFALRPWYVPGGRMPPLPRR